MTSLDLTATFWHIKLALESRRYTGFRHNGFTYQFKVVAFGLKISSAALKRATEIIVRGMPDALIDFVDDWLCVSANFGEHLQHLRQLFNLIRESGIAVNFDKANFCKAEMRFLGHMLSTKRISPDPEKVTAIKIFPRPRNVKEFRGFLGLVNFCAKFTNKIAET